MNNENSNVKILHKGVTVVAEGLAEVEIGELSCDAHGNTALAVRIHLYDDDAGGFEFQIPFEDFPAFVGMLNEAMEAVTK